MHAHHDSLRCAGGVPPVSAQGTALASWFGADGDCADGAPSSVNAESQAVCACYGTGVTAIGPAAPAGDRGAGT